MKKHRGYIIALRESKFFRAFMALVGLLFVSEFVYTSQASALTSGPTQPEAHGFSPAGAGGMVNTFTGDFNYEVPLMVLPGPNGSYPFSLKYNGGVTMDQEASWVGLGWDLGVGAINRQMRGLPDDFDGTDQVKLTEDMKANTTIGVNVTKQLEVFGAGNVLPDTSITSTITDILNLGGQSFVFGNQDTSLIDQFTPNLNTNLSMYYNSYNGFGYGLGANIAIGSDMVNISPGFNLDSQNGVDVNAKIGIGNEDSKQQNRFSTSLGFNSRRGLQLFSNYDEMITKDVDLNEATVGFSYSFAEPSFIPRSRRSQLTTSLKGIFKSGAAGQGLFAGASISGFFNTSFLRDKNQERSVSGFGYENLELVPDDNDNDNRYLTDVNRYKEGPINKNTPNLHIPQQTHDVYTISGQGVAGSFRPHRYEVGNLSETKVASRTMGGTVSFEFGGGSGLHFGNNITTSTGASKSLRWNDETADPNSWADRYRYSGAKHFDGYEKVYYRVLGEGTTIPTDELDFVGGRRATAARLVAQAGLGEVIYPPQLDILQTINSTPRTGSFTNDRAANERMPRLTVIKPTKNAVITETNDGSSNASLGEYDVNYYKVPNTNGSPDFTNDLPLQLFVTDPVEALDRNTRDGSYIGHHNGGFEVTRTDGQRYVYGLPAYNVKHVEANFSVDPDEQGNSCGPLVNLSMENDEVNHNISGTNEYLDKKELPPYAHSYLLTSLLGHNYVDVNNDGPSDEDLGYWVKFDYLQYDSDYKWRTPFGGANYNRGLATSSQDNTGSYSYGEREEWYVARAETKTHIVIFHTSERQDRFEAAGEYVTSAFNPGHGAASALRLDSMSLYFKEDFRSQGFDALPLQRVHFEYADPNVDELLCGGPGLHNSTSIAKGKLTLKRVSFSYQNNYRGRITPYTFEYNDFNPDYNEHAYDRWGNYKGLVSNDTCLNREFPYVRQFVRDLDTLEDFNQRRAWQAVKDENMSAWCLTKIHTPAGGTIEVTYEADDYGYVQHYQATQMTPVTRFKPSGPSNVIYNTGDDMTNADNRRIYFKLEEPIPDSLNADSIVFADYVKDLRRGTEYQLYFRSFMDIRDGVYEDYITGYGNIDINAVGVSPTTALMDIDGDGNDETCHVEGYVTLKLMKGADGNDLDYHPIAMAAWQYMRTSNPNLIFTPGNLANVGENASLSDLEKGQRIRSLIPHAAELLYIFSDYRTRCENQGWGRLADLSRTDIRLCSPDKKKYGGGSRVKKVVYKDNWNQIVTDEASAEYGVVYDYTMEEDGKTISSGVATYEPMIGGDENPWRFAKLYPNSLPTNSEDQLFFEYPINEAYFPGASVGYRQVTVSSLPTSKVLEGTLPAEVATTGQSVIQFYTAKDFPTIVEETPIQARPFEQVIPIPFIGQIQTQQITASQGYMIELNDMHGKPKATFTYGMTKNGEVSNTVETSAQYHYLTEAFSYDGRQVQRITSKVNVVVDDNGEQTGHDAEIEERQLGVDYEYFTDQQKSVDRYNTLGLQFNNDIVAGFPVPIPWPTYNRDTKKLRTIVTNKIIRRSGIITKVEATDGQSRVVTNNVLFDALTGAPCLTTVNNNFDDLVYGYNIPAYFEYTGMGPAYQNIGHEFLLPIGSFTAQGSNGLYSVASTSFASGDLEQLLSGDELLVTAYDLSQNVDFATRATYLGADVNDDAIFHCADDLTGPTNTFSLTVHRSGARNHLGASVGSITALANPTVNRNADILCATMFTDLQSYSIDSVLSIGAVTFSDSWLRDFSEAKVDTNFDHSTLYTSDNPYATGEKGVWLPASNWAYLTDRQQTLLGNNNAPKLDIDGIYNDAVMFQWHRPDISDCIDKWVRGTQMTRYSPYGYDTENKNAIDLYSSALYGYGGAVPVLVAGNAKQQEVGFESFEELPTGANVNELEMSTANIDIYSGYTSSTASTVYDQYEIVTGSGTTIKVKGVIPSTFSGQIRLNGYTVPNQGEAERTYEVLTVTGVNPGSESILTLSAASQYLDATDKFVGHVGIPRSVSAPTGDAASNSISILNDYSHTGQQCLQWEGTVEFDQNRLRLEGEKDYMLSAWVSRKDINVHKYEDLTVQVEYFDDGGVSLGVSDLADAAPSSYMVEGWQQVEYRFQPPSGTSKVSLILKAYDGSGSPVEAQIDDLRIYPLLGNVQTYVYDQENLRVTAVHDQNNWSTLYHYNEEGQLFLTQKETERGIKTLVENRSHLIEQKP